MMQNLTNNELRAVRFYEGDIPAADRDDPFWGDARAYVTLNALLFGGVQSEYTRVREGKRLNPAMLADIPRLCGVYRALFSAAQKGAQDTECCGYRVERAGDFRRCLTAGMTQAFTSTSRSGFLPEYGDKQEIVLLTYHLPAGTPVLIFAALLPDYLKASENELLLPPFLRFHAESRPMNADDRRITDMDGAPPAAAYDVYIAPAQRGRMTADLPDAPFAAGMRIFDAINAGTPADALPQDDLAAYLRFKARLTAQP